MIQDKKNPTGEPPVPAKKEDSANRLKALELAIAQIEKQFGKGSIMKLSSNIKLDIPAILYRGLIFRFSLRHRRASQGKGSRDIRPGILGKDYLNLKRDFPGPEDRRHCRLY